MSMKEKLSLFIKDKNINAKQLVFGKSCHSVKEAAEAANASPEDFVKNICMIDDSGKFVVAIVKGEHRASTSRIAKFLGANSLRMASPEEIEKNTGFPCGGVPSFGFEAAFLIDEKVMEREWVLTGGGSEDSLVKISPEELIKINKGIVAKIRK